MKTMQMQKNAPVAARYLAGTTSNYTTLLKGYNVAEPSQNQKQGFSVA